MLRRCLILLCCLLSLAACARSDEPGPTPLPPAPSPTPVPESPPAGPPAPPALDWEAAMLPAHADDVAAALQAEVPRYDLNLNVDLAPPSLHGDETVRYTNTESVPLNELYLRLYLNEMGLGQVITVSDVALDGAPLEPAVEEEGAGLRLPLPDALEPGQTVTLTLAFQLSLPGEAFDEYIPWSLSPDLLTLAYFLPTIPVYDQAGWHTDVAPLYGDRTHTDVALYRVRLTTPPDVGLVASGVCSPTASGPEGVSHTCVSGPMRDFVLSLSTTYGVISQTSAGVTVNSYYLPDDQIGGEMALEYALGALNSYSQRFGPYPYTELDVVAAELPSAGLEFPGLVIIAPYLYDPDRQESLQWVVAHEVAHQWWYGMVGSDQVHQPWLDEALTEYSTLLYLQDTYGFEATSQAVQERFIVPYERVVASGDDMPVGLPVAAYPEQLYGPIVYRKGALFFDALRQEMGDEAFGALLQSYFKQHRYQIATPESLVRLAESLSGPSVRSLYEQWVLGSVGP